VGVSDIPSASTELHKYRGSPGAGAAARRRSTSLVAAVLLVGLLAGCTSGHPAATGPTSPAPTLPAPSPTPPLPAPTGPPLTAALAATPHFLLSLAGNLSTFSPTAVEGQNLDDLSQPNAVMPGAPLNAADGIYAPVLSRDRKKVAYVEAPVASLSDPAGDGGGEIVVCNVDGSGAKVVATGDNVSPAWSPDGMQIAFVRANALWVMRSDGSNQHALGVSLSVNYYLSWSPDGTRIAVASGNPSQVEVVNLATSVATPVGNATEEDSPGWAPDSQHLVFTEGATNSLYIANIASGSDVTQLTTCASPCQRDFQPAWSPDGASIAFVRFEADRPQQPATEQIWLVAAAGGAPHQVTTGPQQHAFPSW
jgi:Tol biopolymer transport system component